MLNQANQHHRCEAGVTLGHVLIGAVMTGIMVGHLHLGFSQGFAALQLARAKGQHGGHALRESRNPQAVILHLTPDV